MKLFLAIVTAILGMQAHAQYKPLAITDIGVMQENENGTYDVVCLNGNRETVTDLDLKLGNVCPNLKESEPSNILSLQLREDGNFDVVCKDFQKLVATAEEIMAGGVCEPKPPEHFLEDGEYKVTSGYSSWCPQRVKTKYEDNKLNSLKVWFLSPCGGASRDMTCNGEGLCLSRDYRITVLSETSYQFDDNGRNKGIFSKK